MTWEARQSTAQQLALFEISTSSSSKRTASSPVSSEPATSSCEASRRTESDATSSSRSSEVATLAARALVRSTLVSVGSAAPSSHGARSTAERELQRTTFGLMETESTRSMLAIPRPRKRAECMAEARPCPWVGCRHHLAIEVSKSKPKELREDPRATTIRLNRPPRGKSKLGRRAGLSMTSAAWLVREWIDDAIELLASAQYTCVLDIVDDYPDGIPPSAVAWFFGVTEPTIDQELRKPHIRKAYAKLKEYIEP